MKTGYLFKKKRKEDTQGLVYIALYLKDHTELISTGHRIDANDWDADKGYLRSKRHLREIDKAITEIKSKLDHVETTLKARKEIVTPLAVKMAYKMEESRAINEQLERDKKAKEDRKSLTGLVNHWLENNLFQYQPSTQRAVRSSLNQFTEFLQRSGNSRATKTELTAELITAYERYLQDSLRLANSTHGKCMKHLRWFLKTIGYDIGSIKIRNNKRDIITLTQEEITALENIDVSHSSEQQKAKDLFLLGCYTGLRISDLKRINETRIIDGKICMTLQKNKKEVTIPIVPKTKAILERYGNRSPRLAEPVLNRTIKDVCKAAGIDRVLTIRVNIAGRDIDQQKPKYKLISSHTASKTFITLAPQWYGLTPEEVASIVGKDLRTLLNHYYQLPRETAIKKMTQSSSK